MNERSTHIGICELHEYDWYIFPCEAAATEPFGEQAEVTMRTNFWGTLWVSKALLPLLRPKARVVNVSSFVSKSALGKCSPELQAKYAPSYL